MKDEDKSRDQVIGEMAELRQRLAVTQDREDRNTKGCRCARAIRGKVQKTHGKSSRRSVFDPGKLVQVRKSKVRGSLATRFRN